MTLQQKEPLRIKAGVQAELARLLTVLADSKYCLGQHLAATSWMAPAMEASVAASAMAQGQLGRARLLYWLVEEIGGNSSEGLPVDAAVRSADDALPFTRQEPATWIHLIANMFAVKTATLVILEGLAAAPDPTLKRRLKKMLDEELYEGLYAEGWVESLLADGERIASLTLEALGLSLPQTHSWLAGVNAAALASAELLPGGVALAAQFSRKVAEFGESVGVALPG